MKKNLFVALAVLALFSCNKEDLKEPAITEVGDAILKFKVSGKTITSRSTGEVNPDVTVGTIQAFLFDEAGTTLISQSFTRLSEKEIEFTLSSIGGKQQLYVIANAPQLTTVTSVASLENQSIALDGGVTINESKPIMTANTGVFTLAKGNNYLGYTTITGIPDGKAGNAVTYDSRAVNDPFYITRICSRVELTKAEVVLEPDHGNTGDPDYFYQPIQSIVLEDVFILNAAQKSKYFGTSLIADAGATAPYFHSFLANDFYGQYRPGMTSLATTFTTTGYPGDATVFGAGKRDLTDWNSMSASAREVWMATSTTYNSETKTNLVWCNTYVTAYPNWAIDKYEAVTDKPGATVVPTPDFLTDENVNFTTTTGQSDVPGTVYTPIAHHLLFENNGSLTGGVANKYTTRLVIKATVTPKTGTPYTTYYPIVINNPTHVVPEAGTDKGLYLKRNNIIEITATIKSDGTSNPWDDKNTDSYLQVQMTVKPWNTRIVQDVTFE